MVRSIVGTLVEVGRGVRGVATVTDALTGADRALAGQLAPPDGLILWEVGY
jgi:tRNA pseudouridine38-40 synthase